MTQQPSKRDIKKQKYFKEEYNRYIEKYPHVVCIERVDSSDGTGDRILEANGGRGFTVESDSDFIKYDRDYPENSDFYFFFKHAHAAMMFKLKFHG